MEHSQLTLLDFRQAIQKTETFINIGNLAFQKLYLKPHTLEALYENYRQACRYSIEYLKQKPMLQSRDVRIINEILIKCENQ